MINMMKRQLVELGILLQELSDDLLEDGFRVYDREKILEVQDIVLLELGKISLDREISGER